MSDDIRISHVNYTQRSDRIFSEKSEAIEAARELSVDGAVWSVWPDNGSDEILALVYDRRVFIA